MHHVPALSSPETSPSPLSETNTDTVVLSFKPCYEGSCIPVQVDVVSECLLLCQSSCNDACLTVKRHVGGRLARPLFAYTRETSGRLARTHHSERPPGHRCVRSRKPLRAIHQHYRQRTSRGTMHLKQKNTDDSKRPVHPLHLRVHTQLRRDRVGLIQHRRTYTGAGRESCLYSGTSVLQRLYPLRLFPAGLFFRAFPPLMCTERRKAQTDSTQRHVGTDLHIDTSPEVQSLFEL